MSELRQRKKAAIYHMMHAQKGFIRLTHENWRHCTCRPCKARRLVQAAIGLMERDMKETKKASVPESP